MPLDMLWRDLVHEALVRIGGSGSLGEIYRSVDQLFIEANDTSRPATWQAIIRRELEYNSSDSDSYQHKWDFFTATHGIGAGHWSLRDAPAAMQHVEDVDLKEEAKRSGTFIDRIVRNSVAVRSLKALHEDTCQLCATRMIFPNGRAYSEVHHLKPLGRPHNGPDKKSNMIVVCPNCHVLLDFGARAIDAAELADSLHRIGEQFVAYSNSLVRWKAEPVA